MSTEEEENSVTESEETENPGRTRRNRNTAFKGNFFQGKREPNKVLGSPLHRKLVNPAEEDDEEEDRENNSS